MSEDTVGGVAEENKPEGEHAPAADSEAAQPGEADQAAA